MKRERGESATAAAAVASDTMPPGELENPAAGAPTVDGYIPPPPKSMMNCFRPHPSRANAVAESELYFWRSVMLTRNHSCNPSKDFESQSAMSPSPSASPTATAWGSFRGCLRGSARGCLRGCASSTATACGSFRGCLRGRRCAREVRQEGRFALGVKRSLVPPVAPLQTPGKRELRVFCQGHRFHECVLAVAGALPLVHMLSKPGRRINFCLIFLLRGADVMSRLHVVWCV